MTQELFREDAYAKECIAKVVAIKENSVLLDRTIFYPLGGGQPGDTGEFENQSARVWKVTDTRKDPDGEGILHILDRSEGLEEGMELALRIDWERRYAHMRMHTCLHLLCSLIEAPVTGGNISVDKGRLDFYLDYSPDKDGLESRINALVAAGHPVSYRWITDEELDAQPELVRTLSVQPPKGAGKVRLVSVDGVDLQPCGGTHVKNTAEIGPVLIGKIENKGKGNRRVNLSLASV
ncbi:predicted metal-dependent Hydrolase related to alanyl-tRNA synthetase HxxxH domain [Hahella chejuensis KCTC 2396]|uniref:Alanine--tRNA ligase n=2 Tax=Hahella chejuensis TaxID=158327 RepID=Q2SC82_HAHCH|nr:predicted metal-dependent Hydrolase related to alanyl-tRNA synthetase HxxxH domain [Hahella chejuensis KCTC 2396]